MDKKIRFQKSSFQRQLEEARGYRRDVKKIPENSWEAFLYRIGLGSIWSRVIVIVIVIVIVYLTFFPSFLFIDKIVVNNKLIAEDTPIAQTINNYFKTNKIAAQQNFLFLSKENLKNYLLDRNKEIYTIEKIEKVFPSQILLELKLRTEEYFLETPSQKFILANDGFIMREVDYTASSSTSKLLWINLKKEANNSPWPLPEQIVKSVEALRRNFAQTVPLQLQSVELESPATQEFTAFTTNGIKVLFDIKLDSKEALERLRLVLNQYLPQDREKILYIDLRFKNRGYVCEKNTPCADPTILNPSPATSTPQTIKN